MYQTMDKRPKVPKIHMFKTSDLMPPMMLIMIDELWYFEFNCWFDSYCNLDSEFFLDAIILSLSTFLCQKRKPIN